MRAMLAETRKVLKLSEGNPVAYYLQAMLAARAHKFELARSLYKRTGGAMANQPPHCPPPTPSTTHPAIPRQPLTTLQQPPPLHPTTPQTPPLHPAPPSSSGPPPPPPRPQTHHPPT